MFRFRASHCRLRAYFYWMGLHRLSHEKQQHKLQSMSGMTVQIWPDRWMKSGPKDRLFETSYGRMVKTSSTQLCFWSMLGKLILLLTKKMKKKRSFIWTTQKGVTLANMRKVPHPLGVNHDLTMTFTVALNQYLCDMTIFWLIIVCYRGHNFWRKNVLNESII